MRESSPEPGTLVSCLLCSVLPTLEIGLWEKPVFTDKPLVESGGQRWQILGSKRGREYLDAIQERKGIIGRKRRKHVFVGKWKPSQPTLLSEFTVKS